MLARALAAWGVLLVCAVLNGGLRDAFLVPRAGEATGHWVSVGLLCLLIFVTASLSTAWIAPSSMRDAASVGALWLALTIAFEFLAGHYLFGSSWDTLLADYRVDKGRLWVVVLVATLAAPIWAQWMDSQRPASVRSSSAPDLRSPESRQP